jgi:hypothetical protein
MLAFAPFLAISAAGFRFDESFLLKHTFKQDETSKYSVSMTYQGKGTVTCDVTTKVVSVSGEDAEVEYTADHYVGPSGFVATVKSQTKQSKVGPIGMPEEASINRAEQMFLFLGMAGMAPNASAKLGDTVKVHWVNNSKDATFDGTGVLRASDSVAKTLTVDWTITLTPGNGVQPGVFTLKSIYSTDGFELRSSKGSCSVVGITIGIDIARK